MFCATRAFEMSVVRKTADQAVDAFLAKAQGVQTTSTGAARLIFAMDATMSRQPTWDSAVSLQGQMFVAAKKAGQLAVQLVYFRGFNECQASKFVNDPETLAKLMTKVDCRGGNTQIGRVLAHVKAEAGKGQVKALIFVGDACEEAIDGLCQKAGEIGLLGVPLFMFQEGNDGTAATAFKQIAKLTRGAYYKLDENAPHVLAELLGAVAAYATGGHAALETRGGQAARALLSQLK
jgi:hypothetical protein